MSEKDPRWALLPATVGPCGDGNPSSPLRQDRYASLLVVRRRRAPVQAPSLYEVTGIATADEEAMEGCRGGLKVEEAASPVGEVSVGGEGHGRRTRVSTHHKGGVQRHGESAPGGQGGGREGRGGGPKHALDCTSFLGHFLLAVVREATSSFFCFSFVFLYCWRCGRPTMTG